MRTLVRLFAIVALTALSACSNLTSDNPVGGSMPSRPDARLVGVWKVTQNEQKGEAGYMFVSPTKDGAALHVVFVGWSATEPSETLEFDVTTTSLGGLAFVNLDHFVENGKPASPKEINGYVPYVYKFDKDGTLVILDHTDAGMKLIKTAIDKHRLAGKADTHDTGANGKPSGISTTDIHLSASQKSLDAFFAVNAKAIFTDSVDTFQPVKVP